MTIEKALATRFGLSRLEKDMFSAPDPFFCPAYLWMWNNPVTKEAIVSQLDTIYSQGARGVWVLPVPKEHRAGSNPTNLQPEYLTDEFLRVFEQYVIEMKKRGMKVWLYDEGGWPSGSICGRIVRENPSLAQQHIERQEIRPVYEDSFEVPEDCLAAFMFQGNKLIKRLQPGKREEVVGSGGKYWPTEDVRIELYRIVMREERSFFHPPYPDILNPQTFEVFIRLTHEVYKKWMGEHFGDTIPIVVSDEMNMALPPAWTPGLAEEFKKDKGYDLIEHLPSLFQGEEEQDEKVRIDFFDWCTQRFADNCETIRRWCSENGLMWAGHLGPEDDTLAPYTYGRYLMRVLRSHDIPGTDTIYRQIFPYASSADVDAVHAAGITELKSLNHYFPKYTSSVAHQEGRPWAFTESFAVYGSGLTLGQMKWITNFQYVRGMNLMLASAIYLSSREYHMGSNTRPDFHEMNPLFRYMEIYNSYTARLTYLMSLGQPAVDVAVYYPVWDMFAGGSRVEEIGKSQDRLVQMLFEKQCDFDFIDDDILERETTQVKDGVLEAGAMKYTTIYVSRTKWMKETSRKRLKELVEGGGRVVWVDNEGPDSIDFERLEDHIEPLIGVEPASSAVRVCIRQLENGRIYLVTNEEPAKEIRCRIEFPEQGAVVVKLDPESGKYYRPEGAVRKDGSWEIPLCLPFAGSAVYLFTDEEFAAEAQPAEAGERVLGIDEGWRIRKLRSYRIGEHELEVKELEGEADTAIELGDWVPTLGKEFSGDVEYTVEFECSQEDVERGYMLDLGEVRYACEAKLNGTSLGKRVWPPFAYQMDGLLQEGKNELKVVVTNTLANQYVTTRMFEKFPSNIFGYSWPSLYFERDSVASGLYGPVQVMTQLAESDS